MRYATAAQLNSSFGVYQVFFRQNDRIFSVFSGETRSQNMKELSSIKTRKVVWPFYMEYEEYSFECWTNEGKAVEEQVLNSPSSCGMCTVDVSVMPTRRRKNKTTGEPEQPWHAIVGSSHLENVNIIRGYVFSKNWEQAAETIGKSRHEKKWIGQMPDNSDFKYPEAIYKYAGFWRRLLAFLIDQIAFSMGATIIILVLIALFYVFSALLRIDSSQIEGIAYSLPFILYIPLLWLYRTIMESSKIQGTLGKLVVGIIVTDMNYRRISFGRANGRFWSSLLTFETLGIGFIIAAFTRKRQAMHDFIAQTLVIKKPWGAN